MTPTQSQLKLGEIADWIFLNRWGNAFKGFTYDEIVAELWYAECRKGLHLFTAAETGKLIGVACAEIDHEAKTIFVTQILSMVPGLLFSMLEYAHRNWPGYLISGKRFGEPRSYPRLLDN